MKKLFYVLTICISAAFLSSCLTTLIILKAGEQKNYGVYNPQKVPEEDLCTIIIDKNINVSKFNDDDKVKWNKSFAVKTVKIQSGVHTFHASYNDGKQYSKGTSPVIAQLEKGNTYLLKGAITKTILGNRIDYFIVTYNDKKEGEEVTLNINKLQGNDPSLISSYIKYVLTPTMDSKENTVKLENDSYVLIFKPDMVYTLTDKKTEKTIEGRFGFSMDVTMTNRNIFVLETDITQMSRKEFMDSKYQENSQTVLIPIKCSDKEVTYKYEKPAELQGKEITFSITEMNKLD